MPASVLATGIASALAAFAMYARKKSAKLQSDSVRLDERLDAVAVKDATVAPHLRLVSVPDRSGPRSQQD